VSLRHQGLVIPSRREESPREAQNSFPSERGSCERVSSRSRASGFAEGFLARLNMTRLGE